MVLRDSSHVDLERVEVRRDTIFGRGVLRGSRSMRGQHAIPVSEVANVLPGRFSPIRTVGAIIATGLVGFAALALALSGAMS